MTGNPFPNPVREADDPPGAGRDTLRIFHDWQRKVPSTVPELKQQMEDLKKQLQSEECQQQMKILQGQLKNGDFKKEMETANQALKDALEQLKNTPIK